MTVDLDARSAVYAGTLVHQRSGPGPAGHFTRRVVLPLLDVDELDAVCARHPLWSAHHPAPAWVRRADYWGAGDVPLRDAVLGEVAAAGGPRDLERVAVLGHVRTWGWLFNPLTLYFCSRDDGTVEALVAVVRSTPWHEEHAYVLGPPGVHDVRKALHVSPFLPSEGRYSITYGAPGPTLRVGVRLRGPDGTPLFAAGLSLHRQPADRRGLGQVLWGSPLPTHRVSAGIYGRAAGLWLRGAPFHPHPRRVRDAVAGNGQVR